VFKICCGPAVAAHGSLDLVNKKSLSLRSVWLYGVLIVLGRYSCLYGDCQFWKEFVYALLVSSSANDLFSCTGYYLCVCVVSKM
jgi:hypothetical protein